MADDPVEGSSRAGRREDARSDEQSRWQLRAVAENATLALFLMDERQRCVYMNPAAERLTGYSLDEVRGRVLHEVVHHTRPDGRPYPLAECPIDRALPQKVRERGEEVFVHRDGTFYPVAFTASPIQDGGRVAGTVVEVRDIREERRLEHERDEVRVRLASVFRTAPAFICTLREPGHVFEMANPAYRRLVGDRPLIGRSVGEVLPEAEEQGFIDLLDGVAATGEPYVGTEVPIMLRREAGAPPEERFLNFVYQPLADPGGAVTGILVHGVDVTELVEARRRAEEQAEELQHQAVQLEEVQAELEASNDELAAAKRSAEEAHAQLEAVVQQMPSGVLVAEAPSGRILFGNEQVERIWRKPFDPGTAGWHEEHRRFHADGRPYRREEWPLERSLHGETVMDEEIVILRGDGTRGVISVSTAPVHDAAGEVVAAVAVFDDVTERAQHEAEQAFLVETARILSSSLDYTETLRAVARLAVPRIADWCAVDVLEEDTVRRLAVVHSDPGKERLAHELARRWPEDPDGATGVHQVMRTGEAELYEEIPDELLRAGARSEEHLRMLRELGLRSAMILPMVARGRTLGAITLIFAESGRRYDRGDLLLAEKLVSRAAMAVDNARLYAQAQRALREAEHAQAHAEEARRGAEAANRAKSDFLANMSHEMRTPLNAVIGYADLLGMGVAGPVTEKQASYLERVRASTEHLLGLINDILDLARVESGRVEVRQEPARVADVVAAALSLLGPQAAERGVELQDRCGEGDTHYVGDEDRVRQILVNVIGNAVKFTPEGGRVTVACGVAEEVGQGALRGERGPWTFIEVEDTGIGIAPDQVERIFRPFEQAQGGYTREAGGTGLGLSISRQLALLMGGDVTVVSKPGEGSTFTLWLPSEVPFETASLPGAWRDARPRGLAAAGKALLGSLQGILERFRARLASDPLLPAAPAREPAELEDHYSSFLSDLAATLITLEGSGEARERLLRDGSEIQGVVADLHGRQRAQLGWTEEALHREFDIVREEVLGTLERSLAEEAADLEGVERVVQRLVERARTISLRAFRAVASGIRGSADG